jgi:predicted transcriptional regulator of viral defense system
MTSISSLGVARVLQEKGIKFITRTEAARLLGINKTNTVYKLLQRLVANKVLQRVTRGVYLVSNAKVSDFEIANATYRPSYISLESALSHCGILSQFPFSITSVTTRRRSKFVFNKEFEYAHINNNLYWGFVKNDKFVIATPEKAFLDMLYFHLKGLRKMDIDELDISGLDKKLLSAYTKKMNKAFIKKFLSQRRIL